MEEDDHCEPDFWQRYMDEDFDIEEWPGPDA